MARPDGQDEAYSAIIPPTLGDSVTNQLRMRFSVHTAELKEPPAVPVALGLRRIDVRRKHGCAHARHQDESEGSRTSGVSRSYAAWGRAAAGNCSTVARWPSHRRETSTTSPSGNSNAS